MLLCAFDEVALSANFDLAGLTRTFSVTSRFAIRNIFCIIITDQSETVLRINFTT